MAENGGHNGGNGGPDLTQVGVKAAEIDNIIKEIREELAMRLEVEPSDKDFLAMVTALAKACVAGIDTGLRLLADDVAEQLGVDIEVSKMKQFVDPWVEQYGESS